MRRYAPEELRTMTLGMLASVGAHPEDAAMVADSLIQGNLAGHDSHGVLRLPTYIHAALDGQVKAAARPSIVRRKGATGLVDGAIGYGQPGMWMATGLAREIGRDLGVACVAVQNSYHIGRVAPYVESLAKEGLIGIAFANAAPAVAPYGSSGRVFGTNPIAWAVPRADRDNPLSHDIATAAIAEGKLRVARAKGVPIAPGLLVNRDGIPTTDPNEFYEGGAILAFGGHKGSGLALLAQVLGRGLAGMDPSSYDGPRGVNGPVLIAIDPECFMPYDDFIAQMESQCAAILNSACAAEFDEILLPGEPERRARADREAHGIPLADRTVAELAELCGNCGVTMPEAVGEDEDG
jgi:LDH2 family malate/lactate/ureidoglycolate dehydrogenase